jgi:hypothetical protein
MRIIVCNPIQDAGHSNGIAALGQLTRSFCDVGIDAFILPLDGLNQNIALPIDYLLYQRSKNPAYQDILARLTKQVNRFDLKIIASIPNPLPEDVVVLYPETTTKNFLNASKVIRYLGARDGIFKEGACYQKADEKIFTISHSQVITSDADFMLFYPHIANEYLNIQNNSFDMRTLSTSYVGKGNIFKKDINQIQNTVEITRSWPRSKNEVAILLASSKFFYTYDHWSNITLEAVLCGAIPVFVGNDPWPDFNISRLEIGTIPHLNGYPQTDIDPEFLIKFSQRRLEIIKTLKEYERAWPTRVAELCERLKAFFRLV